LAAPRARTILAAAVVAVGLVAVAWARGTFESPVVTSRVGIDASSARAEVEIDASDGDRALPESVTASVSVAGPRAAAVVRAGRAFRITARVRTTAATVKVSCAVAAGGRAVRATGTYAGGTAVCVGSVPKGAAGKLTGTMSLTAGGATGGASFSFPIR